MRFKLVFHERYGLTEPKERDLPAGAYSEQTTTTQTREQVYQRVTLRKLVDGEWYHREVTQLSDDPPEGFLLSGSNHRLEEGVWKREVIETDWYIDMPDDVPTFREKLMQLRGDVDWDALEIDIEV